jgi:hypothetical protein
MNFESTLTEADFKRPLLDTAEERIARELHPEPDLAVDGLGGSVLSWLVGLLGGR